MYGDGKDLEKFMTAQERDYGTALSEIQNGYKRSHWMWYIFPQMKGLGFSSTAQYYGIRDLEQAKDYLEHPVLGPRLKEITAALLELPGHNATAVMGYPDDLKLRSCMTLFEAADPDEPLFGAVLDKYYDGSRDENTLELLGL